MDIDFGPGFIEFPDDDRPTRAELENDREDAGCRCRHNTSDPERGCECGWADYLADGGDERDLPRGRD